MTSDPCGGDTVGGRGCNCPPPFANATHGDEQATSCIPVTPEPQNRSEGREWTIDFGNIKPLSANGSRGSHWARAAMVKTLRDASRLRVKAAKIPELDKIAVELHYAPKDKRRRDAFNLVPTLKPIEDGIVDAGVIPDDTAEFSVPTVPVIDAPTGKPGRVYVVVREVAS